MSEGHKKSCKCHSCNKKHQRNCVPPMIPWPICQPGSQGPQGVPGAPGATGATGTFELDFVVALAAPSVPNQTVLDIAGYYRATGPLAGSFDLITGIFTSPTDAYYLVTVNITYERILGNAVQIDDGTRQMRIVRPFLSPEPAFIGQSVWVTLPEAPTGPFYSLFNVKLSAAGAFEIPAGGQIFINTYQDNSGGNTITAFTEVSITKLADIDPLDSELLFPGPLGPI